MKKLFTALASVVLFCVCISAQTPYDSFAPEQGEKDILQLPDSHFQISNDDLKDTVRFALFDEKNLTLSFFTSDNTLIRSVKIKPLESKFLTMDRFAEKFPWQSPYCYAANNPVKYIDVNGDSTRVYVESNSNGGLGHAWMSVGEGKDMTVYSFGRYAGTYDEWHGINAISNGPGVLLRLEGEAGANYNKEKMSTTNTSVYVISDVTDKAVGAILNSEFMSSTQMPTSGEYKSSPSAHIIGDYKLMSNNCATTVSDVLNMAGSRALQRLPDPKTGMIMNDRFIIPASLGSFLRWQSSSYLGNHNVIFNGTR